MNEALAIPEAHSGAKRAVDLIARATRAEINALWQNGEGPPSASLLRGPETGLVMVQGRIGGGGAPFNMGEVTVSRCSVRLASGTIGHAQALGTDREKARLGAIAHALWQEGTSRERVEQALLTPVEARLADERQRKSEETAATRVDFFTMVRGED